jgi:hypothetical protein
MLLQLRRELKVEAVSGVGLLPLLQLLLRAQTTS